MERKVNSDRAQFTRNEQTVRPVNLHRERCAFRIHADVQLIFQLGRTKLNLGTGLRGICLRGWRECPTRLSVASIRLVLLKTCAIYLTLAPRTRVSCFVYFIVNSTYLLYKLLS